MGQLNALNDSLELRIYTGPLIQQNFRATKVVLPVTGACSSFTLPISWGCMPNIPQPWGKYGPFLQKWAHKEYFISLSWRKNPKKQPQPRFWSSYYYSMGLFSSYADRMAGGCRCLSNFFGMESFRKKGKESTHSPAFVMSFQGFGIISLCICCAV